MNNLSLIDLAVQKEQAQDRVLAFEEVVARRKRRQLFRLFPEHGPLRREKYTKHMEFFAAGAQYMERCFMAGNRVGKTYASGYELTCHATGWYPWWWRGRRFKRPIRAIVAGRTNKNTRDILQKKLLGAVAHKGGRKTVDGTGIIPGDWIQQPSWAEGVRDLIDTAYVANLAGGVSEIKFKSYEQGPGAFEGTEQDVIALDEEPPMNVYGEALMRLTSTTGRFEDNGIMMLTFTPLLGYSDVVIQFMPEDMRPLPPPGSEHNDVFEEAA